MLFNLLVMKSEELAKHHEDLSKYDLFFTALSVGYCDFSQVPLPMITVMQYGPNGNPA